MNNKHARGIFSVSSVACIWEKEVSFKYQIKPRQMLEGHFASLWYNIADHCNAGSAMCFAWVVSNMIDFFICRVFGWTYMVFFFSGYSVTLTEGLGFFFFRITGVFTKAGKERDLATYMRWCSRKHNLSSEYFDSNQTKLNQGSKANLVNIVRPWMVWAQESFPKYRLSHILN